MTKYKYLLFDLDGTITDSEEGICKCVQYALKKQNIIVDDLSKLRPFIGPPLKDSFMEIYGMDEEAAAKGIVDYRERFSETGIFENKLYEGIDTLLYDLNQAGYILLIASSKPKEYVERILEHFEIRPCFHIVIGATMDEKLSKKEDIIKEALKKLSKYKAKKSEMLMIGDRCFDVKGAKACDIDSLGVTYGFGSESELNEAGATYIVKSVAELRDFLVGTDADSPASSSSIDSSASDGGSDDAFTKAFVGAHTTFQNGLQTNALNWGNPVPGPRKPSFFRAMHAILPLIVYYVVTYCCINLCLYILTNGQSRMLRSQELENISIPAFILIITNTLVAVIMFFMGKDKDYMPARINKKLPLALLAGAFTALSLNLIAQYICTALDLTDQLQKSSSYSSQTTFGIGLILFGLTSPIMEELIFRWLMYGRIKMMVGKTFAIIISAMFFGIYHSNIIQGIYAFIMGVLLALIYEWCHSIAAPILFHIGANVFVYASSFLPEKVGSILTTYGSCAVLSVLAIITILLINKYKETA